MHLGDDADALPLQITHDLRVVDDIAEHADGFALVRQLIDHLDRAADAEAEAHFVREDDFHAVCRPLSLVSSIPSRAMRARCYASIHLPTPGPLPETGGGTHSNIVAD